MKRARLDRGYSKVHDVQRADRRCAFVRKNAKLNTKSPLGGGRSKVCATRDPRTGGALTRRFFSRSRVFQHGGDCKLGNFLCSSSIGRQDDHTIGHLFPGHASPGGDQKSATADQGPVRSNTNITAELQKSFFGRVMGRRWSKVWVLSIPDRQAQKSGAIFARIAFFARPVADGAPKFRREIHLGGGVGG